MKNRSDRFVNHQSRTEMPRGLYFHVPFCLRKCPYCDFYSVTYAEDTAQQYVQAVIRNLRALATGEPIDTVYFGGGTPSLLTPAQVGEIMDECGKAFSLTDPEITMEVNPAAHAALAEYCAAGVNRFSIGVQSLVPQELSLLGRLHGADEAERTVCAAVETGARVSCDMMIGLAGQTQGNLLYTADRFIGMGARHISAYMLKIEAETPFAGRELSDVSLDEDGQAALYGLLSGFLVQRGFPHYEISNYAVSGEESRHNMKYWQCGEYYGIGPGAHSFLDGCRFAVPRNLEKFLHSQRQEAIVLEERVNPAQEYLMLGLRLEKGIYFTKARALGLDIRALITQADVLEKAGLVRLHADGLALTERGFLVSNAVIVRLLEAVGAL